MDQNQYKFEEVLHRGLVLVGKIRMHKEVVAEGILLKDLIG